MSQSECVGVSGVPIVVEMIESPSHEGAASCCRLTTLLYGHRVLLRHYDNDAQTALERRHCELYPCPPE